MLNPACLEHQWSQYRKRQQLHLRSLPASVAIGLAGGFLASALNVDWIFYVLAFSAVLAPALTANYVWLFRCPHCDNRFASGRFWRNPYTRKCLHCGRAVGSVA